MVDATTKIVADTRPAKSGERDLTRAQRRAQRKANRQKAAAARGGKLSRRVGQGLGILVANRMFNRRGGDFDMWEDSKTRVRAVLQQQYDDKFGSARAKRRAREMTKANLTDVAATLDVVPSQVHDVYAINLSMTTEEERGRNILRMDQTFSPDPRGVVVISLVGVLVDFIDSIARLTGGYDDEPPMQPKKPK